MSKNQRQYIISFFLIIGLITIACEGPAGSQGEQGLQGEQGNQGPEGEQGPPGEDGNANATLYIFPPHDFEEETVVSSSEGLFIDDVNILEFSYSAWLIYLHYLNGNDNLYYLTPGDGWQGWSYYESGHRYIESLERINFFVRTSAGSGEAYIGIHVFRIASNAVEDCTDGFGCKRADTGGAIPTDLDLSDYQAVMDYYGLTEEDAVRVSSQ